MDAVTVTEYGGRDSLELQEAERPTPGPNEVRVEVSAAGVNYADIEQRRGTYRDAPEPPYIPGMEVAGTVDAVGDSVADIAVGDQVACFTGTSGGYAEYAIAPADWSFPIPETVPEQTAGGILVKGFTAHNTLFEWGGLQPDETVLVHAAAGGVGSVAVQLAANSGAEVVATASTEEKLKYAAELGADHLIQYTQTDVAAGIEDCLDGASVDLVLDGVGGQAFYNSLEVLAQGGRIVSFGVASGDLPTVTTPRLFYGNMSVVGYHLLKALNNVPERVFVATDSLFSMMENGKLESTVTERQPLENAASIHEAVENRETHGRAVLLP